VKKDSRLVLSAEYQVGYPPMAFIHERPSGKAGTLCSHCHLKLLESMDEDAAILRADEDDDHIWAFDLSVGKCQACRDGSISSRVADRFYGDAFCTRFTVYTTVTEFVNITKGITPANVTTRVPASVNAGGHLASLKSTKIFHTVRDVAMLEILPYIGALMSHERELMDGCFWGPCCGFVKKDGVIRRYPVSLVLSDGSKVDRFAIDATDADADAIFESVHDLALNNDVRLLKDPEASDDAQFLAVKFGPSPFEPIFWANTVMNGRRAINGRMTEVYVPMTLTTEQEAEISKAVEAFVKRMKDSKHVKSMIFSLLFMDWKSKKWTAARAEQALKDLQAKYDPYYKFKGQIKLEPGKDGKPPRLIIADGDVGQVMAWCVFGLIERYLYSKEGYKHRSIKGVSKKARMGQLHYDLRHDYCGPDGEFISRMIGSILENDGSAWDACMSARLRALIEEPLIEAASDMFKDTLIPESCYTAEHLESTKGKYIVLTFPVGMREFKVKNLDIAANATIDGEPLFTYAALKKEVRVRIHAIRRSGHRGTSVLNWFANHILWAWVLFGRNAYRFADPNLVRCTDVFGHDVRVKWCFEGDDSILFVTHLYSDLEMEKLAERWKACGHRPKLFLRKPGEAAEFCGWKMIADQYGIRLGSEVVDVPRQWRNGHTCIAPEAVKAAVDGDRKAFASVVVPGILCRAYNVTDRCPSLGRYFLNMAEYLNGGRVLDSQFSVRMLIKMGQLEAELPEMWRCDGGDLRTIETMSEMDSMVEKVYNAVHNSTVSLAEEANFAVEQGWVASTNEWNEFISMLDAAGYDQTARLEASDIPGKFGQA